MKRIAIYGKGGIGKSTISSNVSATLGFMGKKVLQIGCDPKHDSTLLLSDKTDETALYKIMEKGSDIKVEDIVVEGKFGTKCVELGGPRPGVGCAGRGVIKGLETLNRFNCLDDENLDLVLFDILGDVVCGGFFEPLRSGKTQEMYIVTSGEFNSLFAANNLACGYINSCLEYNDVKLVGIIGNCRNIKNEKEIIESFAKAINIPLISMIPRDNRIEECCDYHQPIIEKLPDSDLADIFKELANKIMEEKNNEIIPTPLKLEELRELYNKKHEL